MVLEQRSGDELAVMDQQSLTPELIVWVERLQRILRPTPLGRAVLWSGDPPEVIVVLSPAGIEVHEYAVEWQGSHTLRVLTRPVGVLPPQSEDLSALRGLVRKARKRRRSKFRVCTRCSAARRQSTSASSTRVSFVTVVWKQKE